MKRRFKTLFTDNPPSHEAITELLDCLRDLADACDSQALLPGLQRHSQEQRSLPDPEPCSRPDPEPPGTSPKDQ